MAQLTNAELQSVTQALRAERELFLHPWAGGAYTGLKELTLSPSYLI